MWMVCVSAAGLKIAAIGSMPAGFPSTMVNPVGVFIQAFAMTTKIPLSAPLRATTMPAHRCARPDSRSQPYR